MRWVLVTCAVALVLAGCGDEGQELRAPSSDQTTTSASTSTTAASSTTEVAAGTGGGTGGEDASGGAASPTTATTLRLTSPAFENGAAIPSDFTCVGDDVSPPLSWTGVPAGTAELAVVVRDPDAAGFPPITSIINVDRGGHTLRKAL